MGFAGAALVYKQQVAMLTDLCEFRREADGIFGRGGAWSTREVDHRVGLASVSGCREEKYVQTDLPAFLCGAVFVDLESAALRWAWNTPGLAVVQDKPLRTVLTNRARRLESKH
jgi:hypothetical protein